MVFRPLGNIQIVQVEENTWIVNIIGQVFHWRRGPPIRYRALEFALNNLVDFVLEIGGTVHMPRIGCGLAGGNWHRIQDIITATLINNGIHVYVYSL